MGELFDLETITSRIEGANTVVETIYRIVSQATLDFTTVGAPDNNVGTVFIADAIGTLGSGDELSEITSPNKRIPSKDTWPALAGPLEDSGNPTDDTLYRIMAQSIVDFTTIGAANNNVGTYFWSNGTGVTLSAVDSLRPILVSWMPYASQDNLLEIDESIDAFKVIGVNHGFGARLIINDSTDFNSDLIVNETYEYKITAKVGIGDAVQIRIWDGTQSLLKDNLTTSFVEYTNEFTALSTNACELSFTGLGTGEEVWFKNLSLRIKPGIKGVNGMGMGMGMTLR